MAHLKYSLIVIFFMLRRLFFDLAIFIYSYPWLLLIFTLLSILLLLLCAFKRFFHDPSHDLLLAHVHKVHQTTTIFCIIYPIMYLIIWLIHITILPEVVLKLHLIEFSNSALVSNQQLLRCHQLLVDCLLTEIVFKVYHVISSKMVLT